MFKKKLGLTIHEKKQGFMIPEKKPRVSGFKITVGPIA
jgi:hypothetical protein